MLHSNIELTEQYHPIIIIKLKKVENIKIILIFTK